MATVTKQFRTTGMHCPSCSMLVQMDVSDLAGVESVTSDHRTGITEVTYDDAKIQPSDIVGAIQKAGYGAEPVEA